MNNKKYNSRDDFSLIGGKHLLKSKRSQTQIITTVLLILIAIGAVAVVSTFIFSLVNDNLTGAGCFKTANQFSILVEGEGGVTCYNAANGELYVTIERGYGDFNLTDIAISAESLTESSKFIISTNDAVVAYGEDGGEVVLPRGGEKKSYNITLGLTGINKVSAVPIIGRDDECGEGIVEVNIPACSA